MTKLGRLQVGILLAITGGCGTTDRLEVASGSSAGDDGSSAAGADASAAGANAVGAGGAVAGVVPDSTCLAEFPAPTEACARCVCSPQAAFGTPGAGCLELYQSCFENPDPVFAQRCSAMIVCGIGANCQGSGCYMPQLCMAQIDAAAMHPAGGTLANCGMGEPDTNACRAGNLLGACTSFNTTMDGPCRQACE